MLLAVLNGNGRMAQFSHPEFGGSGQWMSGGMLMLGDMFNSSLKWRVEGLCQDISNLLANQPGLLQTGSFQSQSQGGSDSQQQRSGAPMGQSSLFVPNPDDQWWPQDLGAPSATGSQNAMRYAYFANNHRLAVKTGGSVWVYDTLDHQIGGFSQQQGTGNTISFSSQYGTVNLSTLPVVSRDGQPAQSPPPPAPPQNQPPQNQATHFEAVQNSGPQNNATPPAAGHDGVFAALERLGELRDKGIVTDEEFLAKKSELLQRL